MCGGEEGGESPSPEASKADEKREHEVEREHARPIRLPPLGHDALDDGALVGSNFPLPYLIALCEGEGARLVR